MDTNPSYLFVKETRNGSGIFANKRLGAGETFLKIKGKFMAVAEIEAEGVMSDLSACACRFSKELYISPKGEIVDYLNHSCSPNAFILKENDELFIGAIRDIQKGAEILIDYSTILAVDDNWEMNCNCGSAECRGFIRKFCDLPKDIQEDYKKHRIVPQYILDIS